jgi:hypothetical protein
LEHVGAPRRLVERARLADVVNQTRPEALSAAQAQRARPTRRAFLPRSIAGLC